VLWAAGMAAAALLGAVVLYVIVAVASGGLRGEGQRVEELAYFLLVIDLAAKGAVLGAALLLAARLRPAAATAAAPAPAGPALRGGLAAGLAAGPVVGAVGWLQSVAYEAAGLRFEGQAVVRAAEQGGTLLFLLVAFFAIVAAPVFEEVLFRRFLFGGLRERLGAGPTVLATSVLFSVWHLEPDAMPATFVLGLGLGALRERTGGLLAPLAMHACYNAVQVVGIWARRGGA
jgi:membrane protease YdiL (CAAX protease family)